MTDTVTLSKRRRALAASAAAAWLLYSLGALAVIHATTPDPATLCRSTPNLMKEASP